MGAKAWNAWDALPSTWNACNAWDALPMPGTDVASYQQAGLHTPAAIQDVGPGDGDDNDDESALDNSGSSSSSDSDDGKKLCQIELLKIC